jgi:hypothetical protein
MKIDSLNSAHKKLCIYYFRRLSDVRSSLELHLKKCNFLHSPRPTRFQKRESITVGSDSGKQLAYISLTAAPVSKIYIGIGADSTVATGTFALVIAILLGLGFSFAPVLF